MKPVFMSRYERGNGDPLRACVASILEVDIDGVPDFGNDEKAWITSLAEFCQVAGFSMIHILAAHQLQMLPINCTGIMIVRLENQELHAIVVRFVTERRQDLDSPEQGDAWCWRIDPIHDPNQRGTPTVIATEAFIFIGRLS